MSSAAQSRQNADPLAPSTYVARDARGRPIERQAVCARCGGTRTPHRPPHPAGTFTQSQLAPSAIARAPHAYAREIPDGWVPIHCGPCERHEMTGLAPGVPRSWTRTARGEPIHERSADDRYERAERAALQDEAA